MIPLALKPTTDLDERDAAIVRAVVWAWRQNKTTSYREIEECNGISKENVCYRIWGGYRGKETSRAGLVERGWLLCERWASRTLRPGPRFGGISWRSGVIYEQEGWELLACASVEVAS